MNSIADLLNKNLPQAIQKRIADSPEEEAELWAWVSEVHYAVVVAQAGESHEVVALKKRFDWRPVEQACQAYRLYAGKQGVESTHTVSQLCLGVVVKAYHNWSYDTTAQKVRSDSLLRWFVGYRLNQSTFSAVTLWRFEAWLKQHHPHLPFVETLQQIDEDFPEEQTKFQIGDTFAMISRAHEQSRTQLLRTLSHRLLTALDQVTPTGRQRVDASLVHEALFGLPTEQPEWRMQKAERDALEERTAVAAHQLLRLVQGVLSTLPASQDLLYLCLTRWITLLGKALTDEFLLTLNQKGVCTQAVLRTKHEKGAYVMGSAIDPEATFRLHGDRCDLAYNVGVAATPHFVRSIKGVTGATPDSKLVAPCIADQKNQLGVVPPKYIYDRAAGAPKTYAEVDKASDGKTQLVARLIDHAKSYPRFGTHDCTLGEDGILTCPAGKTTSRAYRAKSGDGWYYRFMPADCTGCPLADKCRGEQTKPTSARNFFISDYLYHQRKALAYLKTDAFLEDMRLRPAIERIIACLVRYHGARHASGYGVANADYQAHMAAMAFNLKAWVKLTTNRKSERRKSKQARPVADTS